MFLLKSIAKNENMNFQYKKMKSSALGLFTLSRGPSHLRQGLFHNTETEWSHNGNNSMVSATLNFGSLSLYWMSNLVTYF